MQAAEYSIMSFYIVVIIYRHQQFNVDTKYCQVQVSIIPGLQGEYVEVWTNQSGGRP